jgi:catechol-2,3-dioxygenase
MKTLQEKYVIIKSKKDVERMMKLYSERDWSIFSMDPDGNGFEWYYVDQAGQWRYHYNRNGTEPMKPYVMTVNEVKELLWKYRKYVNQYTKYHNDDYKADHNPWRR